MGAILCRDYLEGCLTLSVCLAVNLESSTLIDDLTSEDMTGCHGRLLTLIMSHVYYRSLSIYRLETPSPVPKVRPLTKLRRLHIETLSPVHVVTLPNLQTLHIQGSEEFLVLPSLDLSPPHGLRTLKLIDTYGSPDTTKGILSGGYAVNLRKLVFRRFCGVQECSCQLLIDTLIEHCPNLEDLELSLLGWHFNHEHTPLTNLNGLTNLRNP